MPPIPPMPCRSLALRADQGIGRGPHISGRFLARQGEATGPLTRELHKASRHELATTCLWIDQGAHRLSEGSRAAASNSAHVSLPVGPLHRRIRSGLSAGTADEGLGVLSETP